MTGPALKVVPPPKSARPAERQQGASRRTQLQLTRALARAYLKRRKAEALLRAADAEIEQAFFSWAANRSIARDEAEAHLESTGFLPARKVWER